MGQPPFETFNTEAAAAPVLISVPHAGRVYSDIVHGLNASLRRLLPLEDRYADLLATGAIGAGASALVARTPRLWIDLNRAEAELDPAMVEGGRAGAAPLSARARGGLGLIPRRLAAVGEIWRMPLAAADVAARVDYHRAYHAEIAAQLARIRARFGVALLVDLHSMPPLPHQGAGDMPDIVIGDRWGSSAAPRFTAAAESLFAGAGLRVAINTPYAGGHIVMQHARPRNRIHAIQIEVDRRLYLDSRLDTPGPGLARMQALIGRLVTSLGDELLPALPVAAE